MRSLFLLFGFAGACLLVSCGCARRRDRSVDVTQTFKQNQSQMVHNVYCANNFRTMVEAMCPQDDRFSLSYEERNVSQPSSSHCLPYPFLDANVHFPPLAPKATYILYCPHTGCPLQPEFYQELRTDEEGNPLLALMFEEFQKCGNLGSIPLMIMLYANPGYCSDWYLITPKPFSALHTTFTYKPITVSDAEGRTMTLSKKEPGGNLIEISLTGFPQKKRLLLTSASSGERIARVIDTDKNGSYTMMMAPQVIGAAKGVDHITISTEGICLEASCEWDISTMNIARRQPHSPMWECMRLSNPGRSLE